MKFFQPIEPLEFCLATDSDCGADSLLATFALDLPHGLTAWVMCWTEDYAGGQITADIYTDSEEWESINSGALYEGLSIEAAFAAVRKFAKSLADPTTQTYYQPYRLQY